MSFNNIEFNNTDFNFSIKNSIKKEHNNNKQLKFHQFAVNKFYRQTKDIRGLLICHSTGQGKTRLAVSIAVDVSKNDPTRKIIVLSAKSLADNFKKELFAYVGETDAQNLADPTDDADPVDLLDEDPDTHIPQAEEIADQQKDPRIGGADDITTPIKVKFISLNSSNMFKQVENSNKTPEELKLEQKFGEFIDDVADSLENSLLIIDEAHNLFNAITNNAKNAVALYDLIMSTSDIRVLFMSGTPIINHPFELVPCFNMLRGFIQTDEEELTIFSEDIDEFEEFFVDREHQKVKNKAKFMNRITGLVSYYGDLYFNTKSGKPGFPKELPIIIEKVPMSETQFKYYVSARMSEQDEGKYSYRNKKARFSSSSGAATTYRVKSRQISNYAIPETALGPIRGKKSREKFIDKITPEELRDPQYSPKMAKIISNLEKDRLRAIVYSQFVSGEGINLFAKILEVYGWIEYRPDTDDIMTETYKDRKVFARLTGDVDPENRTKIINEFNELSSPISLLLLSGAVAEGIDLKRVRAVHVMEPFWNQARINQVKARAIRYLSHKDLPQAEQTVQVYIYLSDYPKSQDPKKIKEPTTDVDLYEQSVHNNIIIQEFMLALAESSFDCSLHIDDLAPEIKEKLKCNVCAPTHQKLFNVSIRKDMRMPNPCTPLNEKKIKVTPIEWEGETYYYRKSDTGVYYLYSMNNKMNAYTQLSRSHPAFVPLMEKLMS